MVILFIRNWPYLPFNSYNALSEVYHCIRQYITAQNMLLTKVSYYCDINWRSNSVNSNAS